MKYIFDKGAIFASVVFFIVCFLITPEKQLDNFIGGVTYYFSYILTTFFLDKLNVHNK